MKLSWCPECKVLKQRDNINTIALNLVTHISSLNKEPIYRAYCCVRKNGPEHNHHIFTIWNMGTK